MAFDIMTGAIVGVASFSIWVFTPEFAIASMYFLGELGGVPILLNKLILDVLILILFVIAPNRHLQPFSMTPSIFIIGLIFVSILLSQTFLAYVGEVANTASTVFFFFFFFL